MSIANLTNGLYPEINITHGKFFDIDTRSINANPDYGTVLFIGAQPSTVDMQIGTFGGNPATMASGIFIDSIERGGTIGVGQLDIGIAPETTSVQIGAPGQPLLLRGDVSLPSTGLSYNITDSFAFTQTTVGFSGALSVASNGALITIFKIANMVTFGLSNLFTRLSPAADALDSVNPIILNYSIPASLRPALDQEFMVGAYLNGVFIPGRCTINTSGVIGIGSLDTFHFTAAQTCGVVDFNYSYSVI